MATTYENMTVEHLGHGATEADLARFRDACERVLPAFKDDGEPWDEDYQSATQQATDYVWNDGDFEDRLSAGACIYCGNLVDDALMVPPANDDNAWIALAPGHQPDCEWIATRAHRQVIR